MLIYKSWLFCTGGGEKALAQESGMVPSLERDLRKLPGMEKNTVPVPYRFCSVIQPIHFLATLHHRKQGGAKNLVSKLIFVVNLFYENYGNDLLSWFDISKAL
jgi:hypothetical protein